ncbi:MAG TPA: radical SAM protein [Methylomusa anaerophila]|uniref:Molybdenum cofactor biosynthesis protein A n=1 Tax=Methylomusa anaerophila TaxID=1930071 RepID=A0A348AH66_9FIRM|nr:radical SAM protein [Methylomusa anaerophila]BBB90414.1 molybdenum cofactor biosynthesis protein A [Methylomusa anaerophila]HML90371.1 radical SAM protein [Methylomusa anaerophila]
MASEIKPICGLERVKLANAVPLNSPFTLFVFPTTHCNFKCVYCGHSLGQAKMKEKYDFAAQNMPMNTYQNIIVQAKEFPNRLKMISLTGHGEPLMNKNLCRMIELAKKANIAERVEIITNASLLTRDTSKALIDAGLDTIRISLQGLSSAKYMNVCGYSLDFEEFIANICYFYKNKKKCNVYVKVMDVALETGEDEKFYTLFADISDRMYIEQCRPVYDGVNYTGSAAGVTADRYGRVHHPRKICPLPFFMLGIFPDGDVEPCDTIYKPVVIGNVNEDTLYNIWNSRKLRNFQIMQLSKQRNNNPKCAVCCAPDDVSHQEDVLDEAADHLLRRLC